MLDVVGEEAVRQVAAGEVVECSALSVMSVLATFEALCLETGFRWAKVLRTMSIGPSRWTDSESKSIAIDSFKENSIPEMHRLIIILNTISPPSAFDRSREAALPKRQI